LASFTLEAKKSADEDLRLGNQVIEFFKRNLESAGPVAVAAPKAIVRENKIGVTDRVS
jgi:hypothetical protein